MIVPGASAVLWGSPRGCKAQLRIDSWGMASQAAGFRLEIVPGVRRYGRNNFLVVHAYP